MNIKRFVWAVVCLGLSFCLVTPFVVLSADSLPRADFSTAAKPANPLDIAFTDQSTGDIAKWKWEFGDGSLPFIVSYEQKPEGTLVNISIDTQPTILGDIIVAQSMEHNDFNHNGIIDPLLYYYNISSNSLVNTNGISFSRPGISNNVIAFITREYNLREDLNGDGKFQDIVMYYDVIENKIVSTAAEVAYEMGQSISGNIIAFATNELSIERDMDGNGLIKGWVVRYFDKISGKIFNTRGIIFQNVSPRVSGNIIAFPTYEFEYKGDLNGDGDMIDLVLRYYDTTNNELVNTRAEMMGGEFTIFGDNISFMSREGSVGAAGTDLNGDGDTDDSVVRYFDVSTGRIINTEAEIKSNHGRLSGVPVISEHIIAFTTAESSVGSTGADLNNDGDMQDDILRYYDLSTGRIINTGAEISLNPFLDGKKIVFITDEKTVGRQGVDLNNDGDTGGIFPDRIARYFDVATGNLYNTGVEISGSNLSISDNIITFSASENAIGPNGFDHNENGNIQDRFLRYFIINGAPSMSHTFHKYSNFGTYTVILTVTDKNGVSSNVSKVIEVKEAIPAPTASFTALPLSGNAPLTVRFTDTSTNNPISWLWNFGDGQTGAQQNPSHTYNTAGTYAVSLTVSNTAGSNTKTIPNYITVTPPDITSPAVIITQPLDGDVLKDTITIKASASDDRGVNRVEFYLDNTFHSADNTSPYEYSWDTQSVSDGLHSIKAKAYDEAGNSAEQGITVGVNNAPPPVNHPPVLAPIGNQIINEGKELRFIVSAADPDNDGLTYSAANLPTGATFNPITRTFSWTPNFNQSGAYSVTFNVTDNKSPLISETIAITVNDTVIPPPPVNHSPVAKAGSDQTVESGQLVRLDGAQSFDTDGDTLSYQWRQIAGEAVSLRDSNRAIAGFTAPEVTIEQTLEFQLTVTDSGNLSSIDTTAVIVKPKPEVKPAIQITNPQNNSIIAPRSKITISANLQDDGKVVKKVSFLVNHKTYRASKNRQGAYYYNWSVPYGYSKAYNIQAQAQDKQKNIVADDSIIVFSSGAPTISLTSPQNNQTVLPKTSIPVTANLSPNNIGITKVEFYINNQKKHTDRNFPYSYNWRVPKEPKQTYNLQAKAFTRDEDSNRDVLVGESEMVKVRVE